MFTKTLFTLCMVGCMAVVHAQTIPEVAMENVAANYTNEKIYLHYDKANYVAGETIWFKAYIMEGFLPAVRSTTLNVDLINQAGQVVDNQLIPIVAGAFAKGGFEIPKTAPEGSYTVRAFTRRMMNFGVNNIYQQSINVYSPTATTATILQANDTTVYFLPEGGNFIAGVPNNIAFKSVDKWGYPVEATIQINDNKGTEVANTATIHNGLGQFDFTPATTTRYTAIATFENGVTKQFNLPDPIAEGVVLNIKRRNGKLVFEVDKSTVKNNQLQPEYILGVEENAVAFKAPLNNGKSFIAAAIPVDNLETGILQVTVFNANHQPLAERLVFINKNDFLLPATIASDKVDFDKRKLNTFSINLPEPIKGSYSVAVIDEASNIKSKFKTDNIYSKLILSNELKGFVFEPTYYFEKFDDEHQANLDLVMLTNGWRRYSWEAILGNTLPPITINDLNYVSVSGDILHKNGKPFTPSDISIFVRNSIGELDYLPNTVDDKGHFNFTGLLLEDTAQIAFKVKEVSNDKVRLSVANVVLKNNFKLPINNIAGKFETLKFANTTNAATNNITIKNGITLDEVAIKARTVNKLSKVEKRYVTSNYGGIANQSYDFINYPPKQTGLNIVEYLRSRLSGINIQGRVGSYSITLRNPTGFVGANTVPQVNIFIDDIPADAEQLSTYSVDDIALINYYSSGARAGIGGALVFYTKKPEDRKGANTTNAVAITVEGFTPIKQFFSPNYSNETGNDILNDQRSTLYWNPDLLSDGKSTKIDFSFYNSDNAKAFNIIVEGLTAEGKFVHIEKLVQP